MTDFVVVTAHPKMAHSRVTRQLMLAAAKLPAHRVHVRDLYALYPDYLIDVAAEQACLRRASLLVWLQPIYWYGMPPLLKLWLDEVFAFGWAYGPGGQALRGKHLWLVASTGGPAESYAPDGYNHFEFEAFLPPYQQSAALTGMHWLPPLLLHGAHQVDTATLQGHIEALADKLQRWPDWASDGIQPHASNPAHPSTGKAGEPPASASASASTSTTVPSTARPAR